MDQPEAADKSNPKQIPLQRRQGFFPEGAGRKHYGFVKNLSCSSDNGAGTGQKYRVEAGDCGMTTVDQLDESWIIAQMENPETETRWYYKYFLGRMHQYYLGIDANKDTFVVATCLDTENKGSSSSRSSSEESLLRCMLFRKTGCLRLALRCKGDRPFPIKMILQSFSIQAVRAPKAISCPTFQKELHVLESQEGSMNFKFGVLYCKQDQLEDDEFFSNETGSPEFDKFTEVLGDKVELTGFNKYRGGLDVRTGTTGTHSVHTKFQGHQVMFHVSTMLPFSKQNKQQLERKRHLGNDIVMILFFDGDELPDFQPSMIKSHFNHIFAVVCYSKAEEAYKLHVYSDRNVPLFSPALPNPAVFNKDNTQLFRSLLLVKMINGEKACYQSQTFKEKRQRTLNELLNGFDETFGESHSKLSDMVKVDLTKSVKRKNKQTSEFIRFGQELKAHEVLKGDVPNDDETEDETTSTASQTWEAYHFMSFPGTIDFAEQAGDSLIVHSDDGTTYVLDGQNRWLLFDKSITVRQLIVCEEHNILLVLGSKYVYCFRLSKVIEDRTTIARNDMKPARIEASKGAGVIAVCRGCNIMLRLAVAIGRRLQMFVWKSPSTNKPNDEFEGPEGFLELESIAIQEAPSSMLLVDHHQVQSYQHNKVILSYRNVYDVVDEHTHDLERLYEKPSGALVTSPIVGHYEEDKVELLVTYNNTTCFKDISPLYGLGRKETVFHWTCMPHNIASKFPYVIAFGADTIEIRLYINGTVVKNLNMRNIKLLSSRRDMFFLSSNPPSNSDGSDNPPKGQSVSHIYCMM